MSFRDVTGCLAGLFGIMAFNANDVVRLRRFAMLSNGFFVAYGLALGFWPVVLLPDLVPVERDPPGRGAAP